MSAIDRLRAFGPSRWSKLPLLGLGLLLFTACPPIEEPELLAAAGEACNFSAGGDGLRLAVDLRERRVPPHLQLDLRLRRR